jgi:hypothetical protein
MKNVINYIQITIFAGFSFIKTNKAEAEGSANQFSTYPRLTSQNNLFLLTPEF